MKQAICAPHLLAIALLLAPGCKTPVKEPVVYSPAVTEAVMTSLTDIFDGSWAGVTVYIEESPCLPPNIEKIGDHPAKVTQKRQLAEDALDMDYAPAIATIKAAEQEDGTIIVTVKYTPLKLKEMESLIAGGTFEYVYRVVNGEPVMQNRVKSLN